MSRTHGYSFAPTAHDEGVRPEETNEDVCAKIEESLAHMTVADKDDTDKVLEVMALEKKLEDRLGVEAPKFPQLLARLRNKGQRSVEQLDTNAASSLILETKHALCKHSFEDKELASRAVVILVGQTGSGKSTTGNWIAGASYNMEEIMGEDSDGEEELKEVRLKLLGKEMFERSDSRTTSKTFLPGIYGISDGSILIDFPGFFDSHGPEIRIGMDLAFRDLINRCIALRSTVHVLALVSIQSFTDGRGSHLRRQFSKLQRHLPLLGSPLTSQLLADTSNCCRWAVGVTKCSEGFAIGAKKEFKEFEKFFREEFDAQGGPPLRFYNMNKHMLQIGKKPPAEGGPMTREQFIADLIASTKIPVSQNIKQGDHLPKHPKTHWSSAHGLVNDMLDGPDVEHFRNLFNSGLFAKQVMDVYQQEMKSQLKMDLVELEGRTLDWMERVWHNKWHNKEMISVKEGQAHLFDDQKLKLTAPAVDEKDVLTKEEAISAIPVKKLIKQNIERQLQVTESFAELVKADTKNIVADEILALESRLGYIKDLSSSQQCRLTECWIHVEDLICGVNIEHLDQIKSVLDNSMANLHDAGFLNSTQWKQWENFQKEAEDEMDKMCFDMGYVTLEKLCEEQRERAQRYDETFKRLVEKASGLASAKTVANVAAGVGAPLVPLGLAACMAGSPTFGSYFAWFAVGAGFGLPVLAGTTVCAAGCGLAWAYASYCQEQLDSMQEEHSGKVALEQHLKGYSAVKTAMAACVIHRGAVGNLKGEVRQRMISHE